jgi:hypothetical protein
MTAVKPGSAAEASIWPSSRSFNCSNLISAGPRTGTGAGASGPTSKQVSGPNRVRTTLFLILSLIFPFLKIILSQPHVPKNRKTHD